MIPLSKIALAAGFGAIMAASAQAQLGGSPIGTGTAPTQPGGAPAPVIAPTMPNPSGTIGSGSRLPDAGTAPSDTKPGIPGAVSPGNPNAASRPSVPNIGGSSIITQPGQSPCITSGSC
jgi:hypothetical protein